MATCSFILDSGAGAQDLLGEQFSWTGQIAGRIQGRAPPYLSLRSQALAHDETAKCSRLACNPARPTKCLAGERPSSEGRREELLWRRLFLDHTLRWDNREDENNSPSPDFRHKESGEVLWLNKFSKPDWVDAQLAALDMQMGRPAPPSNWGLRADPEPLRPAGYERDVKVETVSKLCEQGQLSQAVEALGVLAQTDSLIPKALFRSVLNRCVMTKDLVLGRRVHALTVTKGSESDTFLFNHILRMYASQARLQEAMDVFTVVAKPDAFMWSSIISAHVQHGQAKQAIQLYHQMRISSVKPDGHVFVAALQACARASDLETGQQVHSDVLISGVDCDLFVCCSLVDMYAKCGSLEDAQRVFDGLPQKNVVTWNAMISGYSQKGMGEEALRLYSAMQQEGIAAPDRVTFVGLLQACATLGIPAMEQGKELHRQIVRRGLDGDVVVGCSLVNMYAKCGKIEVAQRVFDKLPQKNIVTWNAMIAGYSQQGMAKQAFDVYSAMQEEGIAAPNSVTFSTLLQACASVGTSALEKGKHVHAQIKGQGLYADVFVANSLINMYAKCGSIEDAQLVFDKLGRKDVVTWNAMIAGYSQQGMGQEALGLYSFMQQEGIAEPDSVTFVSLLQACASVAALNVGRQLHAQIEEKGLLAYEVVSISLINMYAKSGSMMNAQQVFDALPEREVIAWNALIAGYTRQGDSTVVFDLLHRMKEGGIQPNGVTMLSVLTVCSHAGLVNQGRELFDTMSRDYGITPSAEHYSCMVDLLSRAGHLHEALLIVRTMPVQAPDAVWHTLLGACQKWGNVEVGRCAFDEAVKLDEKDAAAYVSMSNIYTAVQMWEEAVELQVRRKQLGAWKQPGQSWWTDMDGLVHSFSVGERKPSTAGTALSQA